MSAREDEDILTLVNLLRSGLVRNLGNITSPRLSLHAYAGTKLLIDDYITQVALSIQHVTALHTATVSEGRFDSQAKLELLHDTRQAFGRTTLLLQGGSIFGLCHLGVVKALHLQGLLPRIITGTATGALIAALVGVHTEDELLTFLNGDGIDLTAFDRQRKIRLDAGNNPWLPYTTGDSWLWTLLRRVQRYIRKGYFLDAEVLEECVRANLGDLTFEEAYARSKRILNITVATSDKGSTPNLLNYLTAPNVLIWSAAVASNASSNSLYQPVTIYCKDETGSIVPWGLSRHGSSQSGRRTEYTDAESPLTRIAELFNVNHFIVSQARPYLIPFLRSDVNLLDRRPTGQWSITRSLMRLVATEIRHRLRQLDYVGLLPQALARLLIEETIPGPNLTLVPDLSLKDFTKLFQNPDKESLAQWILRGERGTWPAISALKVRCVIEIELDKGYQVVRRRRPAENPSSSVQHTMGRPQLVKIPVFSFLLAYLWGKIENDYLISSPYVGVKAEFSEVHFVERAFLLAAPFSITSYYVDKHAVEISPSMGAAKLLTLPGLYCSTALSSAMKLLMPGYTSKFIYQKPIRTHIYDEYPTYNLFE
ncbi:acyl transferase/acyl hydrolase/lysophospholipase [Aspergillus flavus]|uniref:Acyl transferase/acyl hydrolase/lysophospholipase n=1 Tax=Aspergillus flavus TaxID=5059 RepID=A0A5N6GCP1_ASPFL|nr:acyl transferase/acyl hydrolase/lysophospholipase [Aspergillus flavus]